MTITYTIVTSPFGRMLVGATERGVSAVSFGDSDAPLEKHLRDEYEGAAIARDLADHGWQVAVHYRNSRAEAERLVAELGAAGRRAVALCADLSDAGAAHALVDACCASLGAPTCLINNASEFRHDDLATLTHELWAAHMDVNLEAPVLLARALARRLPAQAAGNVINIIDQRVWRLTPEFFSYTLSKAALWTATRTMALHYAPRIRVNAIGPGPSLPERGQSEDAFRAEQRRLPLERGPELDEFTAAALFFLGAPSVTGQMIALDGGRHLLGPEL